jgi:hypothetical protein
MKQRKYTSDETWAVVLEMRKGQKAVSQICNADPALPRPTRERARKEGVATAHAATSLILERHLLSV